MANIDVSLLQNHLTDLKRRLDHQEAEIGSIRGGGPPTGGGSNMEARVAKLESDIEYIKRDVGDITLTAKVIQGDVSVLKTQSAVLLERTAHLEKNMVTKTQLATYASAVLITIVGGAWWIIQQYLSPLITAVTK